MSLPSTATRVGRISGVTISGTAKVGETITWAATSNLSSGIVPFTYRLWLGGLDSVGAEIQPATAVSYLIAAGNENSRLRVSARQGEGGIEVFSDPVLVLPADEAPEEPEPSDITIYSASFATDRTADFVDDGVPVSHDPTSVFNANDEVNEGAKTPGAMVIGAGVTGNVAKKYRWPLAPEVTAVEVYWLHKTVSGGTGGSITTRFTLRWVNASNVGVGDPVIVNSQYVWTQLMTDRPVGAVALEVEVQRRGGNGNTDALHLNYIDALNITVAGATPGWNGNRLPVMAGLRGNVDVEMEVDFTGCVQGADEIEYTPGGTVTTRTGGTGLAVLLTSTAALSETRTRIVAGKPVTYTSGVRQYFSAKRGARLSRARKAIELTVPAPFVALAAVSPLIDPAVEVGTPLSLCPFNFVVGGAWPLTAEITSAPLWVRTDVHGLIYGIPSSAHASQNINVTVTDASGASVNLVFPVTAIAAINTATPDKTVAPGAIMANLTSGLPTDRIAIVHLQAGDYTMGNTNVLTRLDARRVVVVGAAGGATVIHGSVNFNRCEGLEIRGAVFVQDDMPADPDNYASRSIPLLTGRGTREVGYSTAMSGRILLTDCTVRGIARPDLTAETASEVCVRIVSSGPNAGKYIYANDPARMTPDYVSEDIAAEWAASTLPPTTDRYGIGVYGGGVAVGRGLTMLRCRFEDCVIPLVVGSDGAFVDCVITGTRTDHLRLWGARGFWVKNLRTVEPRWKGNFDASEHRDNGQTGASTTEGTTLSSFGLVEGIFMRASDFIGIQANQQNTFLSNDGYERLVEADAARGAYDVVWRDVVMTCDLNNGVRSAMSRWIWERLVLLIDPDAPTDVRGRDISPGAAIFQASGTSAGALKDSIVNRLNTGATGDWEIDNVVNLGDGGAPALTEIFPNLANTGLAYDDPRLAVAAGQPASAARFWINPASTWGAANPDVGAPWLRDGVAA